MTHDELRNNWSDAIIALVMNEASAAAMDLSSEDEREAIVQALHDAIEFFATPEFGTEIE
jgi:hypothetical protein